MRESFYCDSLIFHGFKTNDITKAREEAKGGWKAGRLRGSLGSREAGNQKGIFILLGRNHYCNKM